MRKQQHKVILFPGAAHLQGQCAVFLTSPVSNAGSLQSNLTSSFTLSHLLGNISARPLPHPAQPAEPRAALYPTRFKEQINLTAKTNTDEFHSPRASC